MSLDGSSEFFPNTHPDGGGFIESGGIIRPENKGVISTDASAAIKVPKSRLHAPENKILTPPSKSKPEKIEIATDVVESKALGTSEMVILIANPKAHVIKHIKSVFPKQERLHKIVENLHNPDPVDISPFEITQTKKVVKITDRKTNRSQSETITRSSPLEVVLNEIIQIAKEIHPSSTSNLEDVLAAKSLVISQAVDLLHIYKSAYNPLDTDIITPRFTDSLLSLIEDIPHTPVETPEENLSKKALQSQETNRALQEDKDTITLRSEDTKHLLESTAKELVWTTWFDLDTEILEGDQLIGASGKNSIVREVIKKDDGNDQYLQVTLADENGLLIATEKNSDQILKASEATEEDSKPITKEEQESYALEKKKAREQRRAIESQTLRFQIYTQLENQALTPHQQNEVAKLMDKHGDLDHRLAFYITSNLGQNHSELESEWVEIQKERWESLSAKMSAGPQTLFENYQELRKEAQGLVLPHNPTEIPNIKSSFEFETTSSNEITRGLPQGLIAERDQGDIIEIKREDDSLDSKSLPAHLFLASKWMQSQSNNIQSFHAHIDRETHPNPPNFMGLHMEHIEELRANDQGTWEARYLFPREFNGSISPADTYATTSLLTYEQPIRSDFTPLKIEKSNHQTIQSLSWGHVVNANNSTDARLSFLLALKNPATTTTINPYSFLNSYEKNIDGSQSQIEKLIMTIRDLDSSSSLEEILLYSEVDSHDIQLFREILHIYPDHLLSHYSNAIAHALDLEKDISDKKMKTSIFTSAIYEYKGIHLLENSLNSPELMQIANEDKRILRSSVFLNSISTNPHKFQEIIKEVIHSRKPNLEEDFCMTVLNNIEIFSDEISIILEGNFFLSEENVELIIKKLSDNPEALSQLITSESVKYTQKNLAIDTLSKLLTTHPDQSDRASSTAKELISIRIMGDDLGQNIDKLFIIIQEKDSLRSPYASNTIVINNSQLSDNQIFRLAEIDSSFFHEIILHRALMPPYDKKDIIREISKRDDISRISMGAITTWIETTESPPQEILNIFLDSGNSYLILEIIENNFEKNPEKYLPSLQRILEEKDLLEHRGLASSILETHYIQTIDENSLFLSTQDNAPLQRIKIRTINRRGQIEKFADSINEFPFDPDSQVSPDFLDVFIQYPHLFMDQIRKLGSSEEHLTKIKFLEFANDFPNGLAIEISNHLLDEKNDIVEMALNIIIGNPDINIPLLGEIISSLSTHKSATIRKKTAIIMKRDPSKYINELTILLNDSESSEVAYQAAKALESEYSQVILDHKKFLVERDHLNMTTLVSKVALQQPKKYRRFIRQTLKKQPFRVLWSLNESSDQTKEMFKPDVRREFSRKDSKSEDITMYLRFAQFDHKYFKKQIKKTFETESLIVLKAALQTASLSVQDYRKEVGKLSVSLEWQTRQMVVLFMKKDVVEFQIELRKFIQEEEDYDVLNDAIKVSRDYFDIFAESYKERFIQDNVPSESKEEFLKTIYKHAKTLQKEIREKFRTSDNDYGDIDIFVDTIGENHILFFEEIKKISQSPSERNRLNAAYLMGNSQIYQEELQILAQDNDDEVRAEARKSLEKLKISIIDTGHRHLDRESHQDIETHEIKHVSVANNIKLSNSLPPLKSAF